MKEFHHLGQNNSGAVAFLPAALCAHDVDERWVVENCTSEPSSMLLIKASSRATTGENGGV